MVREAGAKDGLQNGEGGAQQVDVATTDKEMPLNKHGMEGKWTTSLLDMM